MAIFRFFVLFISILAITACFSPWQGDEYGIIEINLGVIPARTTGFGDVPFDGIDHELILVNQETDETERIPVNSSGRIVRQVSPGTYFLSVNATINGWDYAYGSSDVFTISVGERKNVSIEMQRLPNAIVLSIPRSQTSHFFGIAMKDALDGILEPLEITISNFTGEDANLTLAAASGNPYFEFGVPGYPDFTIPKDESINIKITPRTNIAYRPNFSIVLNGPGGFAASLHLSSLIVDSIITNRAELEDMPMNDGMYHILGNDIDLGSGLWTPIGDDTDPFMGTLDGNGHSISRLVMANTSLFASGLFGQVGTDADPKGSIRNLSLVSVSMSTDGYYEIPGTIYEGSHIGGIAGINFGTIENVFVSGSILADHTDGGRYVGGIAGSNFGSIRNSYSNAMVTGTGGLPLGNRTIGGIAGLNSGIIEHCYATGIITGAFNLGGILGMNFGSGAKLENCIALNTEIARSPDSSNTLEICRVCGVDNNDATINNYGLVEMILPSNMPTGRPLHDPEWRDGGNVTLEEAGALAWWETPAPSGPGWTVHEHRSQAYDGSPWYWGEDDRPRLWFQ